MHFTLTGDKFIAFEQAESQHLLVTVRAGALPFPGSNTRNASVRTPAAISR